ncbi:MAG: hypothetical protein KJO28_02190 [Desulfofustis sp.]|nr:hypothetical protein [Desulfofustis sp.]
MDSIKSCVNIVEVIEGGDAANLVCCGEKMKLLTENTIDVAAQRYVPVINPTKGGIMEVRVLRKSSL